MVEIHDQLSTQYPHWGLVVASFGQASLQLLDPRSLQPSLGQQSTAKMLREFLTEPAHGTVI